MLTNQSQNHQRTEIGNSSLSVSAWHSTPHKPLATDLEAIVDVQAPGEQGGDGDGTEPMCTLCTVHIDVTMDGF